MSPGPSAREHSNHRRVALLVETSLASGRDILRGIARYVREHAPWSLYHEPRSLEDALPTWFKMWDGDGIIARIQTPAMARAIRKTGIAAVDVLGVVESSGFPLVHVDDEAIAHRAAGHLWERGFRHFGFLGIERENWSAHREKAFVNYIEDHGSQCATFQVPRREAQGESWETQQETLADWIQALPKPSGIMVCSDQRGPQLLEACRRARVSVPDEVAVIGVDNDEPLCDVSNPPLTSVWPGHTRVGYEAAEMLSRLMRGERPPDLPVMIEPHAVVTRRSTEVLAVEDRAVAAALRIIREHACERIRVDQIAAQAAVSRSVLQRRFRTVLGRTMQEELIRQRLKRARQLLIESDLSLLEIAERSGFEHQEYMGAVFKHHLGATPAQIRERGRVH